MPGTPSDPGESSESADSFDMLLAAAVGPPDEQSLGPARLSPGELIGGRFVVEHHAGEGGMGAVYRCRDGDSGSPVALKIVRSLADRHAGRFKREASILALLSHPAIVRYVAHGRTDAGLPYLVMEWLEGEDLGQRLRRERLTRIESIGLVRRLCEGLTVAHARGFIHRDIKPNNIFLPHGDVASAKLLDFGLARGDAPTQTLTRAGTVLGTAGYMAPEQAAGTTTLDRRADLFSLGCVLFECLTGEPAFSGEHCVAVLEKVLRGEAPRVSTLCPSVSAELDRLVAKLLEKSRDARPESALAVARELQRIEAQIAHAGQADEPPTPAHQSLPLLASVLVGQPRIACEASPELAAALATCVQRFDLQPVLPLHGSALLLISADEGSPWVDRAARAHACALWLRQQRPELVLTLGSGTVELEAGLARGSAIESARARHEVALQAESGLALDMLTAALLATRQSVVGAPAPAQVGDSPCAGCSGSQSEHACCYGRDKELSLLAATLQECSADSVARAVLVTGDAGLGKSQLARAFLRRSVGGAQARVLAVPGEFTERAEPLQYLRRMLGGERRSACGELVADEAALERTIVDQLAHDQCSALVVVIDDAQWIDAESLRVVASILLTLAARPLLVVGLARPELSEELRAIWSGMRPEELRLRPLTERAAERLLLAALGAQAQSVAVERVAQLAGGSPRLLAALARALLEHGSELSEMTIALTEERLRRAPATLLGVLCSASVFGESCWGGGVAALQGNGAHVLHTLQLLADQQLLVVRPESRFAEEREYTFAHPLLRAAAYRLLSRDGAQQAHALALRWLTSKCEPNDPLLSLQREALRDASANAAAPARVCT